MGRRKLTNWSLSWLIIEHRNSQKDKRNMKFKSVTGSLIHLHNSLPHNTIEVKSLEGLKIGLKVWPSIQRSNIELVVFEQDFGKCYKPSCSRTVFDLAASWFLLSEVWSMCNAPLTGMPLNHRVYSERASLPLEHPESSEVRDNVFDLCLIGHFLEQHHFLSPLQTFWHCRQG